MTDFEKAIITAENTVHGTTFTKPNTLCVTILDDHPRHLTGHLKVIYKPRMFLHWLNHWRMWFYKVRLGIRFNNSDLINHYVDEARKRIVRNLYEKDSE